TLAGVVVLLAALVSLTRSLQRTYEAAWGLPAPGLRGKLTGLGGVGLLLAGLIVLSLVGGVVRQGPAGAGGWGGVGGGGGGRGVGAAAGPAAGPSRAPPAAPAGCGRGEHRAGGRQLLLGVVDAAPGEQQRRALRGDRRDVRPARLADRDRLHGGGGGRGQR